MKVFNKALDYLRLSLTLKMKVEKSSIYGPYNNIGIVFKNMGNYDSAIFYGNLVIKEALKYKKSKALGEGVSSLAEAYEGKKDYKKATHYYSRLRTITDSVNKEGINSKISDLQSRYESDKKDSDLKLKEESLRTAEALNSRKNIMISLSVVALLMAIIASVFIFRSYKQSKRNALQLSFKNKVIEEKNKEITDSINYAKNIQQSLITSEKVFTENLKDHFILYLPKDIVSGDFYWAQKIGEEFIIMCADCTGHGVPGAFMSLMGIGNLKELVNQKQLTRPDVILNELRERIIESFGMSNNKDGMDASLLKLNGFQMQVAAANNPIWIIRNNENLVVKPDKFPVGNYLGELSPFSLNTIQLQTNDLVLMYTDGYADQFGGPNNKKHKNKAIEKLILDNHHLPLDKIQQLLLNNFQQWKGTNEQVDDVLVIGFRV
jgi:serine phosphatase RsbU (regulator of sigma subunit)